MDTVTCVKCQRNVPVESIYGRADINPRCIDCSVNKKRPKATCKKRTAPVTEEPVEVEIEPQHIDDTKFDEDFAKGKDINEIPQYIYIYTLQDPRDMAVRYVGQTNDFRARYNQHLSCAKGYNPHSKRIWTLELRSEKLKPIMRLVKPARTPAEADHLEQAWIDYFRRKGASLFNRKSKGMYSNFGKCRTGIARKWGDLTEERTS